MKVGEVGEPFKDEKAWIKSLMDTYKKNDVGLTWAEIRDELIDLA